MAADPETQRWWKETDPCQSPLPDAAAKGKIWSDTKEVYIFNTAMSDLLKDKIIFLTGGSCGIGRDCAKAYAAEGANVIVVANDRDEISGKSRG